MTESKPQMTRERQELLVAIESCEVAGQGQLQSILDTIGENTLSLMDELEDDELRDLRGALVRILAALNILCEQLEGFKCEVVTLVGRIEARGLRTTSFERRLDALRMRLGVSRELLARVAKRGGTRRLDRWGSRVVPVTSRWPAARPSRSVGWVMPEAPVRLAVHDRRATCSVLLRSVLLRSSLRPLPRSGVCVGPARPMTNSG
jgi:hypothetical protein